MKRVCPKFNLKGRKFYRNEISNAFIRRKSALKGKLNATHWVCSTADCWSSRRKSFIGVTVHWIDDQLNRQSACLAARRVIGKSSYNVLAKFLEEIYENDIIDVFEGIESDFKESDESNDESEQLLSIDEENVKFIPITGIMNNISSSETMYYLPRHRRCACHTLNLIAKNDIYKEMDLGVKKLIQ